MDRIFEVGELFRRGASLEELLAEVAESVRESVGFNSVLISLADEDAGVMRRTAYAGLPRAAFEQLRRVSPPLEQARSLMQPEYQVSHSYFLPAEGAEALTEGLPTTRWSASGWGRARARGNPDDLLLIPLYWAGGRLLGPDERGRSALRAPPRIRQRSRRWKPSPGRRRSASKTSA